MTRRCSPQRAAIKIDFTANGRSSTPLAVRGPRGRGTGRRDVLPESGGRQAFRGFPVCLSLRLHLLRGDLVGGRQLRLEPRGVRVGPRVFRRHHPVWRPFAGWQPAIQMF